MPLSARPRSTDLRALFHLVGECRDLGDDGAGWWGHYVRRLAALAGADVVHGEEAFGTLTDYRNLGGVAGWGWDGGFDRTYWLQTAAEIARHGPAFIPTYRPYIALRARDDGACVGGAEVISERDYQRSAFYPLQRGAGLGQILYCVRGLPGRPGETCTLTMCRAVGATDFSARTKAVVREAQAAVAPLIGGPLARFIEPSPAALPPRVRQVLRCFLEGDSDKQVMARLGLTRHTVNGYAKLIHRHFGVASRGELLARWVRRGWPVGGWAG